MGFQEEKGTIRWKLHFSSPIEKVFAALATDEGRASYWAESAPEKDGSIIFSIFGYEPYLARIIKSNSPTEFVLEYFGTVAEFTLQSDAAGGTDLSLCATKVPEDIHTEMIAGWVSVLMAMKAAVDHGIDLRNHDQQRTWNLGFVDN